MQTVQCREDEEFHIVKEKKKKSPEASSEKLNIWTVNCRNAIVYYASSQSRVATQGSCWLLFHYFFVIF